ncbi:hypothetical protein FE257_002271 [Aspergillus nanangensis]|uniref:Copper-fist domain-containing protein n=1 Tax=Aspergillus nanangensis TaxID=2582783 RepID=A0AAD4CCX7_ASPNN|nr:hypothetical protein FE257_002271 [Aspergillus nanangensis]
MPLDEEGAKWSCEPCIRGHRSSKCQHFDRLMMKVPKAGRPLAKCPHPKGSCSCQKQYAVMVRIPKGSSCVCRPLYQVPVEPGDPTPTAASTPIAPSPSPSSGKIQKSSNKKQIKMAPENLAKALDSIPEFGKQYSEHITPSLPSQFPILGIRLAEDEAERDGDTQDSMVPQLPNRGAHAGTQGSSCCSKKRQSPVQPQPQASCCSRADAPSSNFHDTQANSNERHDILAINHSTPAYTPVSQSQFSPWQQIQAPNSGHYVHPFLSDPSQTRPPHYLPHYPPHTTPDPLMPFTPSLPSNVGFIPAIMPQRQSNMTCPTAQTFEDDSLHDCHCGDNCQCLGCASHPFNNTTRQHVQQMGLLVALDGDDRSFATMNGFRRDSFSSNHPSVRATPFNNYSYANFNQTYGTGVHSMAMHSFGEQPATPTNTHNGYSSPPTDYTTGQQMMEPSEYYTLEYPVGLPSGCSDVTGSCQCGNDCSCVGCLTHSGHNGLPLEPLPTHSDNVTPVLGPMTSSGEEPRRGSTQAPVLPGTVVPSSASML